MFQKIAAVLLIGAFFSMPAIAAQDRAALCDSCSSLQKRNLAATTAGNAASAGVHVYIADFDRSALSKYFVLSGNPLNPDLQDAYDNLSAETGILSEDKVTTTRGTVTVAELQLTDAERTGFADLAGYVAWLEANGVSTRAGTRHQTRGGGTTINNAFNIPAGRGFDSAFDVVGFASLTREIGQLAFESNLNLGRGFRALNFVSDAIPAFENLIDLNASFEFFFSDGSSALWTFDDRNKLDVVPGTYRDSENNDIPEDAGDVVGMRSFFREGSQSGNFVNTRNLVLSLGFGVTGGGDSGCSFTCDEQSCTVTCRQN